MADAGGASWFKYGCLGCLGLAFAVVLLIVGLAGVAYMSTEEPQVEDRVLTHDVAPAGEPGAGATARELPTSAGTITLDLRQANFEVRPAGPGEPLRVDARYDTNAFEMQESLEEPEGEPWHYTFSFRRRGSGAFALLRQLFTKSDPQVRIFLPPDSPIRLELDAHQGGVEVDLGGLWLTDADVKTRQGGLVLRVPEPLREPMGRFSVDAGMSGAVIQGVGNASPRVLEVEMSMGGLQLDLRGAWQNDAEITVVMNRAGGEMRVPNDIRVEGLELDRFPASVEPEVALPTLRFTSRSKLEDLDVKR